MVRCNYTFIINMQMLLLHSRQYSNISQICPYTFIFPRLKVLARWVRNFPVRFFIFCFFVFVILSYQNACYGCENAENRTWSEFSYDGRKFRRQCVNVIDTWGCIYFLTCEKFGRKFRTQCAMSSHLMSWGPFLSVNVRVCQSRMLKS